MADDKKKIAQEVEKLNEELNKVVDNIQNIGEAINKGARKQFSDLAEDVRNLGEGLLKSSNISKDINKITSKLNELNKRNVSISIEKKLAEDKLKAALTAYNNQASIANARALIKAKQTLKNYTLQLQLNEALEDQTKSLLSSTEQLSKQESLSSKLKDISNSALGSVKDQVAQFFSLAGIIGIIINGMFKADKQIVAMSKSLGVSYDGAKGIRKEMESYSLASKDGFATVERLVNAQQALSEQLGVAVEFSNEERENFARLTELVGLTNEEAAGLARNATITGKSTTEYLASVRNATFEAQRANKIRISDKELLSTISKLSTGILVKFKGNTDALAKAVVQAKALGLTLEQVDKIGDSMLNFEQSIEKELEAELITGKQLNFERARAAALTGDQAALMEELNAQVGSLEDFQNMNVVAQKSLAEAFGMSREEMADMLTKQKLVNDYGEEAAKLNEEQVEEMKARGMNAEQYTKHLQDQRDLQMQFNDLMTRLQEQIAALVGGPLISFLQTILKILNSTEGLAIIFGAMIGSQLPGIIKMVQQVAKFTKVAAKYSIAEAMAKAAASVSSIPVVGWALAAGVAAGLGAMLYGYMKGDDVVSPGYGKRTLMAPEGAIALNDKDTVIAGTNLGGGGGNRGGGGGESMGMVVAAIKDLQNSINKLASRPITVSLDGEKVGTMVGRRNETGTEQVKNSYSLA